MAEVKPTYVWHVGLWHCVQHTPVPTAGRLCAADRPGPGDLVRAASYWRPHGAAAGDVLEAAGGDQVSRS